jgi:hypothetical protein
MVKSKPGCEIQQVNLEHLIVPESEEMQGREGGRWKRVEKGVREKERERGGAGGDHEEQEKEGEAEGGEKEKKALIILVHQMDTIIKWKNSNYKTGTM